MKVPGIVKAVVVVCFGLPLTLVIGLELGLVVYDLMEFQPRLTEMRQFIAKADPAEKAPPPVLVKLQHLADGEHITGTVVRVLWQELRFKPPRHRRILVELTWLALVNVHFSDTDRMTLRLALSPMGGRAKGFARASQEVFGVPLADVSIDQAARLTLIQRSSYFLGNPERMARHAARLVERAN